jgi:hypothetical protein
MENRRCRGARRMPFGNCGRAAVVFGLASGVIGCGMPNTFHITKGQEPQYADDDYVRFRTTYYFRVFDVCDEANNPRRHEDTKNIFPDSNGQPLRLLKDSIYRFRMTGKASSLFSIVHFEAGTLKSYQIDPFGATVAFDETNRRFYFKSQQDTEADAKQDASFKNIRRYTDLLQTFRGTEIESEIADLIRDELRGLGAVRRTLTPGILTRQVRDTYARAMVAAATAFEAAAKTGATKPQELTETPQQLRDRATSLKDTEGTTYTAITNLLTAARDGTAAGAATTIVGLSTERDRVDQYLVAARAKVGSLRTAASNARQAANNDSSDMAKRAAAEEAERSHQQVASALASAESARRTIDGAIAQISALQEFYLTAGTNSQVRTPSADVNSGDATDLCPPGSTKHRGFQVMGPEGIRTFNQDERLIMAMSSDGKPLISTLQDLSNRVLGPQVNQAEQRLPLADERLRISEARRILDREKPDKAEDAAKLLDDVAAKFRNGGASK